MIYSIITFLIIFGLAILTLFKLSPYWIQNNEKINWGKIVGYSILFGLFGGVSILIINMQNTFKKKQNLQLYNE